MARVSFGERSTEADRGQSAVVSSGELALWRSGPHHEGQVEPGQRVRVGLQDYLVGTQMMIRPQLFER